MGCGRKAMDDELEEKIWAEKLERFSEMSPSYLCSRLEELDNMINVFAREFKTGTCL